jgi:hypothetical protein
MSKDISYDARIKSKQLTEFFQQEDENTTEK